MYETSNTFESKWDINLPSDNSLKSIRLVSRPGGEILTQVENPMLFPDISSEFSLPTHWPRWCIGTLSDQPVVLFVAPEKAEAPMDLQWCSPRMLFPILNPGETEALNRSSMLVSWNHTHRFCGCCGTETFIDKAEVTRICPSCDSHFYPRISPAMIVRITNGKKILLAHNRRFPEEMYSCIAGYVDPGETLERTVMREIREEVGLEVESPRYVTSQAWPFPHSLMMGFETTAHGEPVPDGVEITDAQWFAYDALPSIPRQGTISRYLIDLWLKGLDDLEKAIYTESRSVLK